MSHKKLFGADSTYLNLKSAIMGPEILSTRDPTSLQKKCNFLFLHTFIFYTMVHNILEKQNVNLVKKSESKNYNKAHYSES